ncbi:Lsr2 family protein [Nocardiopsis dassonvillei]|uniref:histone-like nucleoid-structuring protein Lsr2 n=1 Tax=Nocardiopsis dassonvillei TaxID=2014 RepID=UPI00201077B5|nr:Lsr2 family protein [Nocardiopsis dassonvillei]MCK9871424.1 Lsr2 family protein [Nocardiopsis dassonvillei]
MAQRVEVFLIDDLDGEAANETVAFSLDGSAYEIDLKSVNAEKLRSALAPFMEAGRKAPSKSAKHNGRTATARERSAEIRAWARRAGKPVNERGRIPQSIVTEFEAAHRG